MADIAGAATTVAQTLTDSANAQVTINTAATNAEILTMDSKAELAAIQGVSGALDTAAQAVQQ
ncbi:hypothetical protein J9253_00965 [Thiothrix litoralis]|jgi:hypothetical protein|uniref:Uncharacterized protein n=1 Tax=Thiothrix litoralis TaxID=2891210 RepID=A0ABX7WU69_9GAMM|nr:hypothetical protein [Thiothrix litoralis]QTR46562.1 hypothetical protein J9253_00965 [Thiothrix litoralis]